MGNNLKNSEEFLKSVTEKNTGFSAPKNYFSDAEDRFSVFLKEDKLPKENGFRVPKDYFEELDHAISEKIFIKKEVKVFSLKNRLFKYMPITAAASIALFLSINYFGPIKTQAINFDVLAESDIENWILENSNELTDEDFAVLLSSEIKSENDFALTDLNNNDIEEYIIDTENSSLLNENY